MTKSKRQLRAEAVERLKKVRPGMIYTALREAIGYDRDAHHADAEWRDALIDLLTDDEPPEVDVLDLMRNRQVSEMIEVLGIDPGENGHVRKMVRTLADMVERGYVRREEYDELRTQRDNLRICRDEWENKAKVLEAERDELKSRRCPHYNADKHRCDVHETLIDGLIAERDKWKARAEERSNDGVKRSVTNLEWLYRTNREFRRFALAFASVETDGDAAEWLMSEHAETVERLRETPDFAENPQKAVFQRQVITPNDTWEDGVRDSAMDIARDIAKSKYAPQVPQGVREAAHQSDFVNCGKPCYDGSAVLDAGVIRPTGESCGESSEVGSEVREHSTESESESESSIRKKMEAAPIVSFAVGDGAVVADAAIKAINEERERKYRESITDTREKLQAERDRWKRAAGRHSGKIKQLKHELQQARKYGTVWPEFEGGGKVEIGDEMMYDGLPERVRGIRFYGNGVVFEFAGVEYCCETHAFAYGQPVDRPPLKAKDGKRIAVGEMLHGGDGRAWVVESIDRSEPKYPVEGSCDGEYRQLKPEWLTHEQTDSWERILQDACANDWPLNDEEMAGFVARCEKLAKEGA